MPFIMDIESLLNEEDTSRARTDASTSQPFERKPALPDLAARVLSPRNALYLDTPLQSSTSAHRPFDSPNSPTDQDRDPDIEMSVAMQSQPSGEVAPPKNLACTQCEKRFARRSDLVRHGNCQASLVRESYVADQSRAYSYRSETPFMLTSRL